MEWRELKAIELGWMYSKILKRWYHRTNYSEMFLSLDEVCLLEGIGDFINDNKNK